MWRSNNPGHGSSLRPVSVPAALIYDDSGNPVLALEDNDGETLFYPPEETKAEGFGSILILSEPSPEQLRTLSAAAAIGYPIEPRIVGEPFLSIEGL